jgi:hypothetical protein
VAHPQSWGTPWMPQPTISCLGPTGHVNLLLNVKVISLYLSYRLPIYKSPPALQVRGTRSFPPSLRELLELSTHPIVTTVHLQYQTTARRDITSKEGSERINHSVLRSSQDHLRIGMCDLDHPVSCWCKKDR